MSTGRHPFQVNSQIVSAEPALKLISVSGELDLGGSDAFAGSLEEALGTEPVLLDMESVTFMDSSALHVVLDAKRKLDEAGVPALVVASERSVVARLFEMTGLTSSLPRAATIEEAKQRLE
jgi:stage II sporulation protein AA (anti-sigma F factor antagonist)